jgi:aminopeptidase N
MNSSSISSKAHLIEDYTPPVWFTPRVALRFDLGIDRTVVRAEYLVRASNNVSSETLAPLFLNGVNLQFLTIRVNGTIVEPNLYEIKSDGLLLLHTPDKEFNLLIENSISPIANTALEGLYHSGSMLCTQNEPEGFRKITYSIDRPDNLIIYTVTLCGEYSVFPVLLSNGNLLSQRDIGNGKHEAIWEDPFPKPSYLFAIVAGNLAVVNDSYVTRTGKTIRLQIYVDLKNKDKTDFAMSALKEAMLWDEETFGLEYDLELYMIVAVDDFNMGAMENKGLNLFNSKLVLSDTRSATDETFESILGVVAHEYFHNWTGNRVTLRNWFNLTLKEGLTVFRDQWFTEDKTDVSVKRIKDVLFLLEHQFQEDAGPMSHPILPKSYVEMNNFYTVTVYEKGAEVIRMLSLLLGRETFKKGLSHYLKKYDGMGVTYEEFLLSMESVSERKLTHFRNWYHRKGTPTIKVREHWNPATQEYRLEFIDLDSEAETLYYPASIAFFDSAGRLLLEEILEIGEKSYVKSWTDFDAKPIVSLFRSFSAPIKLDFERKLDEVVFLAKHEQDGFSRFFAVQDVILREMKKYFRSTIPIDPSIVFSIFNENLKSSRWPKDYLSYLLNLPSLGQLADIFQCYEFEEVHQARLTFLRLVANRFQDEFEKLYNLNSDNRPDQSREQIGKRKLKNIALYYLAHADGFQSKFEEVAFGQQTNANHMSEELPVLRLFCELGHPLKAQSISQFYEKWKEDPLVIDYWFSAQVSFGDSALPEAETLLKSASFHYENPNRVRALIGAFARNSRSFHKKDGSGYQFLGKSIEKLGAINPQMASNLGKLFQTVASQSVDRRKLAGAELRRILDLKDLSADLEEVLSKIWKSLA